MNKAPRFATMLSLFRLSRNLLELCARQSIDSVDDDLESVRKSFSPFIASQTLRELTSQHAPGAFVVLRLNCHTGCLEVGEVGGVGAKEVKALNARRMHGRHVQKRHV